MSRRAVWLQLVLGWLPLWALFTVLIYFVHSGVSAHAALFISLRSIIGAVILGFAVQRFTEKFPWPSAVHIQFVLLHIGAALAYAFGWFVLNSIIESLLHLQLVIVLGVGVGPFLLV